MAKKKKTEAVSEEASRQSRKEVLLQRKHDDQMRQVKLGIFVVGGLILVVLIVALINEFVLVPGRSVATVSGEEISLDEWQDRVQYERAQRVVLLETQLVSFQGDVGIIQQFFGQTINELLNAEVLGEAILDQMINEKIIQQAAEERGIQISEADIDASIEENFNYYGGESPPPAPTAVPTTEPTPSVTPIPVDGVVAEPPVVPTEGPTSTPLPTPTAVSQDSFQEEYDSLIGDLDEYGADEVAFRETVRARLYLEALTEALAEEQQLAEEASHASLFIITYDTEEEAEAALAEIRTSDFLTVWNTVRSMPANSEAEGKAPLAREILDRTEARLTVTENEQIAEIAFTLPPNVPSAAIEVDDSSGEEEAKDYVLLMVSGLEVKALSESELQSLQQDALRSFVDDKVIEDAERSDAWRSRVPSVPVLDTKFLAQPTAVPDVEGAEGGSQ